MMMTALGVMGLIAVGCFTALIVLVTVSAIRTVRHTAKAERLKGNLDEEFIRLLVAQELIKMKAERPTLSRIDTSAMHPIDRITH